MTGPTRFTVPHDHPALPGHFPGRPVLPGVVLLDHVLDAVAAAHAGRTVAALPAVKFLRPVLPGDTVEIVVGPDPDRPTFLCRVGEHDVARGTVHLRPMTLPIP